MWKKIEDFDFDVVVTALKERIDNPLVYDDNDEDEIPF